MKRCSECGRTYSDETLIYCLADGSLLSAPYALPATLIDPAPPVGSSTPTEVLPSYPPHIESTSHGKPFFLYWFIALAALVVIAVAMVWLLWATAISFTASKDTPARTTSADPVATRPSSTAQINISGMWQDNFGNVSQINQEGDRIQLTSSGVACKGRFESSGSGTISGSRIDIIYRSAYSEGQCQGTVSADGMQITSTCFDSMCGPFQPISRRKE